MPYNHYHDDPSLLSGEEEADEMAEEFYELLAGMAEEINIRTDAHIQVDYEKGTLTIQAKKDDMSREAIELIEGYQAAMPKISILFQT
jgi:hypothetical protein